MLKSNNNIVLLFLLVIYLVGVFGHVQSELTPYFLMLTPYNLILTFFALLWLNKPVTKNLVLVSIIAFFIGFFVEVAGVKTGIVFGEYSYGKTLGWKVFDVPVVIGFNWVLLSLTTNTISKRLVSNIVFSASLGALLMVGLDVLIEPIAIKFDYWTWSGDVIPLQNYVMWFLVAFVIHLIINGFNVKLNFKIGLFLYLVQVMFFSLLNLLM